MEEGGIRNPVIGQERGWGDKNNGRGEGGGSDGSTCIDSGVELEGYNDFPS